MPEKTRKILLLDLGGVVASLGDPVVEIGLSISHDAFWDYWLSSSLVRNLETGKLSAKEFLHAVAEPLHESPGAEFEERFRQWRIEPFSAVISSLEVWAQEFHLALLSNTNEIHWAGTRSPVDFSTVFDKLFLSFQTGHFKPASEAYTQVQDHYGCMLNDIHFLDDSEKNIRAARALGLNAYRVAGPEAVQQAVKAISER